MHIIAQQNDSVDALCWRHLGASTTVVEQTYLLNPGLAARGAILPAGTPVTLPDAAPAPFAARKVTLWD